MSREAARRARRVLSLCAAVFLLIGLATELGARGGRGGGGRGGGGFGGSRGGGISRGGPASGGSIRSDRAGGGYRTYEPGASRSRSGSQPIQHDGSFETRRGNTIDYSGTVSRTEDGLHREGSWQSSSGASGSGSGDVRIENEKVQSRERTGHVENAKGETMDRKVESERHGDHVDREGEVRTSTGVDAESKGRIEKTDDGFVAQGGVVGKDGAAGGTIVRKGDETFVRGGATDGKDASWGRVHCNDSHCTGGRVNVDVDDYYRSPYYYYPYYYGWYACPYGGVRTWTSRYGTPIYGCSNFYVVHTTIALGAAESPAKSTAPGAAAAQPGPAEAEVSSEPVLMYEVSPEVVAYATSHPPARVYAEKQGDQYFWLPGPATPSVEAKAAIAKARGMSEPTANATVITYATGERIVYLTNERPFPGIYAEPTDQLFAWIPGVETPTEEQKSLIREVIAAHEAGGEKALDREVRKLEANRPAPPAATDEPAPQP